MVLRTHRTCFVNIVVVVEVQLAVKTYVGLMVFIFVLN